MARFDDDAVAVKFSGGRDSSLATARYCLDGRVVQLLRFATGLGIPSTLPELREEELRAAFPGWIRTPTPLVPIHGLVRRIAIADIEADFRTFAGFNLVLLGEALALHTASIAYCRRHRVTTLADGSSGYQVHLPEQRQVALDVFAKLAADYGITYETPVAACPSEDDVKYELLELGLATKSLEASSMFADSFSPAPDEEIEGYLLSKLPLARRYIERLDGAGIAGPLLSPDPTVTSS